MNTFFDSIQASLGQHLLPLLGAVAILLAGWFVALAVRALVRRGLGGREAASKLMEHWLSNFRKD